MLSLSLFFFFFLFLFFVVSSFPLFLLFNFFRLLFIFFGFWFFGFSVDTRDFQIQTRLSFFRSVVIISRSLPLFLLDVIGCLSFYFNFKF